MKYIRMKKKTFRTLRTVNIVLAVILALFIALTAVGNAFAPYINLALNISTGGVESSGENGDTIYYKSAFSKYTDLKDWEKKVAVMVEEEGAVLLKNDEISANKRALPLESGSTVSFFGFSSTNILRCGTGSGAVGVDAAVADEVYTLESGFKQAGLDVNTDLNNYYSNLKFTRSINKITEPDVSAAELKEHIAEKYKNGAAVVTLSRTGGEASDLYSDGGDNTATGNEGNVLALDTTELALLDVLAELKSEGYFPKGVSLMLNSSNSIQLDFLKQTKYENLIDSIVWVGYVGYWGPNAIGNLYAGKANFSGSLVDSYYYDNKLVPAYRNFGISKYQNTGILGSGYKNNTDYVVYAEGIYLGYKYYETRYEDYVLGRENTGDFKYDEMVAYPFGEGLSYTQFEYSDISMNEKTADTGNSADDEFEISVTVKNVGEVAGKHSVQVFAQTPYTDYDIKNGVEKASVQYCGFEKTKLLQPEETDTLKITVTKEEIASYDAYGKKTYILDDGKYFFSLADDSHDAINNILAYKANDGETVATEKMVGDGNKENVLVWDSNSGNADKVKLLDKAYKTGVTVSNQFDHADPTLYDVGGADGFKFLTRQDWQGTFPIVVVTNDAGMGRASVQLSVTETMKNHGLEYDGEKNKTFYEFMASNWDGITLKNGAKLSKSTSLQFEAKNGYTLADAIGKEIDDEIWDKIVDQLSYKDATFLIANGGHMTPEMPSVGKPYTYDENGPVGLTRSASNTPKNERAAAAVDKEGATPYRYGVPSNDVSASTCNRELIYLEGQAIGENALWTGTSGIYGPGSNIHRSPYSGRNFEYVSEDGYVTGVQVDYISRGMNSRGLYTYQKHAILNDQEAGRLGISTWANEQAIREIYVKGQRDSFRNADLYLVNDREYDADGTLKNAFEFKKGLNWGVGIMSGYNRVGCIWNGHDYNLQVNLFRKEFGATGMFLTDNQSTTSYTHISVGALGGTTNWDNSGANTLLAYARQDGRNQYAMKESCKYILYTVANSLGMNGIGKGDKIVSVTPWWQTALLTIDIVIGIITVAEAAFLIYVKVAAVKNRRKSAE